MPSFRIADPNCPPNISLKLKIDVLLWSFEVLVFTLCNKYETGKIIFIIYFKVHIQFLGKSLEMLNHARSMSWVFHKQNDCPSWRSIIKPYHKTSDVSRTETKTTDPTARIWIQDNYKTYINELAFTWYLLKPLILFLSQQKKGTRLSILQNVLKHIIMNTIWQHCGVSICINCFLIFKNYRRRNHCD